MKPNPPLNEMHRAPQPGYLYKEQAECVEQVQQYLLEHLDTRVTQAELARRFHISLTSLKGAFKQVYGLPIDTYLRRCRVERAEQLLCETNLSILSIAQQVGYDSPSRFAAMFKRERGVTPRECRRMREQSAPADTEQEGGKKARSFSR